MQGTARLAGPEQVAVVSSEARSNAGGEIILEGWGDNACYRQ